jgi:hypothetical protein
MDSCDPFLWVVPAGVVIPTRRASRTGNAMVRIWSWVAVIAFGLAAATPAAADRRVAFVVGNAKYEKVDPLRNAQRDAAAMADRLRDLGFEVTEVFDGDAFTLNRAAERFAAGASGADLSLFYFAGHGIQLFDKNFLLARDVDPTRITRPEEIGLDLTRFMDAMRRSGTVRQVLLIDACRDNPFSFEETVRVLDLVRGAAAAPAAAAQAATRGLANVALSASGGATGETMLFFAAQPGHVSFDGTGPNSYFVESLKEELAKPDRPLTEVFRAVSGYVRTVTGGQQVPQVVSDWTADVVLRGAAVDKVVYDVRPNVGSRRPLSAADRELLIRANTGFGKFRGDFVARGSLGDWPDPALSDAEQKRAKELGLITSFTLRHDLDRDGREESLHVFFRQAGYVLAIESAGVRAELASCIDGDQPESIEVALKDINGDRRPEVWISYETGKTTGWGTFCILEYTGLPKLADLRRSTTGSLQLGHAAFRTLLRGNAGWGVTVANDNTIKVCGGTGCHTSWVYAYDGQKFRLVSDQDAAPSGGAALPFADERERAANLFASLSRSGQVLSASPWQASRPRDNTVSVSARVGRTEIAYECSPAQAGRGIAREVIAVRDKPPANAKGGAEIEIQDTLAYGQNSAQAPMLIDGKACPLTSMETTENDGIHLSVEEREAPTCFEALARAGTITLPLLHEEKSLLRVRLGGGGNAISAARQACGAGQLAALGTRPQAPSSSATQIPVPPGAALEARARAFVEDYMRRSEAPAAEVLGLVRTLFASEISYYGKRLSNAQVAEEKRRYLARWPERRYRIRPEALQAACEDGRTCRVTGEIEYRASNPADGRVSQGAAAFELRVQFVEGRPLIVEESGRTLARRNDPARP